MSLVKTPRKEPSKFLGPQYLEPDAMYLVKLDNACQMFASLVNIFWRHPGKFLWTECLKPMRCIFYMWTWKSKRFSLLHWMTSRRGRPLIEGISDMMGLWKSAIKPVIDEGGNCMRNDSSSSDGWMPYSSYYGSSAMSRSATIANTLSITICFNDNGLAEAQKLVTSSLLARRDIYFMRERTSI